MTALQESARKSFEAWKKTGSCFYMSRNNAPGSDLDGYQDAYTQGQWVAWQAALEQHEADKPFQPDWTNYRQGVEDGKAEALAQQELPQKERPDFMAGYDVGMADAKRMAQQATLVPQEWTNLLAYALQDDMHNRLTPRVVDIAYTAFTLAKRPNSENGGASDWFNDTKPKVTELIAKLRKDLIEEFAAAPTPQAQQGEPVAQARLGMKDGLAMALSVVELYGMKGDVIYREIAKLRDGIAAAPAPQQAQGEPVYQYQMADGSWIDQIKDSYDYNRKYARMSNPRS